MNIFNKKTNWIILSVYNTNGKDHIIFVRKDRNGMLYFKTKKITPDGVCAYQFEGDIGFDIREQFNKILKSVI